MLIGIVRNQLFPRFVADAEAEICVIRHQIRSQVFIFDLAIAPIRPVTFKQMLELRYISKVHEIVRSLVEQLRAVIVESVVLKQGHAGADPQQSPHGEYHEQYASHDAGD